MRKIAILGALGLFLAGCSGTHVRDISGPDGQPAHVVECGSDRSACLVTAGKVCPAGYTVIDDATNQLATRRVSVADIYLTVACK